jgi:hypothetical protein
MDSENKTGRDGSVSFSGAKHKVSARQKTEHDTVDEAEKCGIFFGYRRHQPRRKATCHPTAQYSIARPTAPETPQSVTMTPR